MSVYSDTYLPSDEELTVEELNLSTHALRAGSYHFGKACDQQSKEFMLCREEEKDPRKCLQEGREVTACALRFFRQIKKNCLQEFNQYATCIDRSSVDFALSPCRQTQAAFDQCVFEKMGIERPKLGYYSRVRVHDSKRPKPIHEPPEFPGRPDALPEDFPQPPAKYGARFFFF